MDILDFIDFKHESPLTEERELEIQRFHARNIAPVKTIKIKKIQKKKMTNNYGENDIYDEVGETRIYKGVQNSESRFSQNISFFMHMFPNDIFTEINTSTISVNASISNLNASEVQIYESLTNDIEHLAVVSMNGRPSKVNPKYEKIIDELNKKKKKKANAKTFKSCVQLEIYSTKYKKLYKIKLFRNGSVQIPGACCPDLIDAYEMLTIIVNILQKTMENSEIKISHMITTMRNSNFKLVDQKERVFIDSLDAVFDEEYENTKIVSPSITYLLSQKLPSKLCRLLCDKLNLRTMVLEHKSIIYGNSVTFNINLLRPHRDRSNKKVFIKIRPSGKINIAGANSHIETKEIYFWLVYIFKKYSSRILFYPDSLNIDISDDSDYYPHIYSDDEI